MIAITIDCEQWNSMTIRGKKDPDDNNTLYSFEGNKNLLKVLEKNKVSATFFVTGYYAQKEPNQVIEIMKKGHEIECHSYNHFYRGNKELNLFQDIKKSKEILEKVTKKKIIGFRAPQMQYSKELINVLEKLNFKFDSSIHSAYLPGYYNNKKEPLKPFMIGKITEIPATGSYKHRLPIAWIFFRNLPLIYTEIIIKGLIKKGITPVLYFHSWEFFEIKNKKAPYHLRRNTGIKFCKKLDKLLNKFKDEKFVLMQDLA